MPATHNIDKEKKIIFTSWYGEPKNSDLSDALNIYIRDIKSSSELDGFNELVDFSEIKGLNISVNALIELGKVASKFDKPGNKKLAIVVSSSLAYGLARMYGVYRNFNSQSNKKVLVFRSKEGAMEWLELSNESENDKEAFFSRNKPK